MTKSTLLLIGLFLAPLPLLAQLSIQGTVWDRFDKEPLAQVLILQKSSSVHTHTDAFGNFSLTEISPGDSLVFSLTGYAEKVYVVPEKPAPIHIQLSPVSFQLKQITIRPDLKTLTDLAGVDLRLDPINSSQEILQKVPGLFISQHAGGGKAEQIFLRGFDLDHGTDIQISADGIPVNMVSHAHGQGYADLHFLIPETIQNIDFGKGPYYADKGNFTTAGYVDFNTYDKLPHSTVKLEAARFGTQRLLGMFDMLPQQPRASAYIATEYLASRGPFESPQDFRRLNVFGKYQGSFGKQTLSIQGSSFRSSWDASGQIPDRAVSSGQISRFGAIDDTEGGETSRSNLMLRLRSLQGNNQFMETQAFYSHYDFDLYSNFTFFLNDPVHGDQIRQKESRDIYGLQSTFHKFLDLGPFDAKVKSGLGLRYDDIKGSELSRTQKRHILLDTTSLANIQELNTFAFADLEVRSKHWLLNTGLRWDQIDFNSVDLLKPYAPFSQKGSLLSPKLNVVFSPSKTWQLYLKSGKGFHANDARVRLNRQNNLAAAYGFDLGAIFRPLPGLIFDVAAWHLQLEEEFVYVGDEGVVEASGKSLRRGLDFGLKWQASDWLFANFHFNLTRPRLLENESGADYIPLAPTQTSIGKVSVLHPTGFSGSLGYRWLKDRAANEDFSLTAEGYVLADLSLNYDRPQWGIGISVENLFDTAWREAQFETESRLFEETEATTEIHYTPGMPRFVKVSMTYRFSRKSQVPWSRSPTS